MSQIKRSPDSPGRFKGPILGPGVDHQADRDTAATGTDLATTASAVTAVTDGAACHRSVCADVRHAEPWRISAAWSTRRISALV